MPGKEHLWEEHSAGSGAVPSFHGYRLYSFGATIVKSTTDNQHLTENHLQK